MGLLQTLSVLAMRQVAQAAALVPVPGGRVAGGAVGAAAAFLAVRFNDSSQRVPEALRRSTDRAWRALEIALAGESLLSRLDRAEDKAFRQQVRTFLDGVPTDTFRDPQWRKACLSEVRAVRQANEHLAGPLDANDLAQRSAAFLRYTDPAEALDSEWRYLTHLGEHLRRHGHANLAELVSQRVGDQPPLLVVAVRFFFRIEVENDPRLFQGLTCESIDRLSHNVQAGFAQLDDALRKQGDRLAEKLDSIDSKLGSIDDKLEDLRRKMERLLAQPGASPVRQGRKPPVLNRKGREAVREVINDVKSLPVAQQRQPDMLLALGKLRLSGGDCVGARRDFAEAAELGGDPKVQAEVQTMLQRLDEMNLPAPAPSPPRRRRGLSAVLGTLYVSAVLIGAWMLTGAPENNSEKIARSAILLVGISVMVGGSGGWVMCSVRSWVFVLLCTLFGLVGGLTADAIGRSLTTAGSLANLCYGAGLGVLVAYAVGVPVKGLVDLATGSDETRL